MQVCTGGQMCIAPVILALASGAATPHQFLLLLLLLLPFPRIVCYESGVCRRGGVIQVPGTEADRPPYPCRSLLVLPRRTMFSCCCCRSPALCGMMAGFAGEEGSHRYRGQMNIAPLILAVSSGTAATTPKIIGFVPADLFPTVCVSVFALSFAF